MKKVELLAPAGDLIKLKTAIDYGADAVYIGGKAFSLRVASQNFSNEDMIEGITYTHNKGKKVYVALNIIPHNEDLDTISSYLDELYELNVDAVIVADMGMFDIVRNHPKKLNIHISTQASTTNYASVNFYKNLGAKRVVLARELSLSEIDEITTRVKEIEIECFVHGAMCISYSGRCLLSNYMTGRDSNMGDCAQSCRWNYRLMEEKRPGEYLPVYEDERGTYIFNSKDMCMIEHVGSLIDAGVTSFKIEGRVKSEYYVAAVVKAYRQAIDDYYDKKPFNKELLDDITKISHRDYTTGFYFEKPTTESQVYTTNSYIRRYELIGVVKSYNAETKEVTIEQRNRFFVGDEIDILNAKGDGIKAVVTTMRDANGVEIEVAPHPQMEVTFPLEVAVEEGSFIRKKRLIKEKWD